jgi:hypothetical protein
MPIVHDTSPQILIVSNRVPVTVQIDGGERSARRSAGGLWIGWPGPAAELDVVSREVRVKLLKAARCKLEPFLWSCAGVS